MDIYIYIYETRELPPVAVVLGTCCYCASGIATSSATGAPTRTARTSTACSRWRLVSRLSSRADNRDNPASEWADHGIDSLVCEGSNAYHV